MTTPPPDAQKHHLTPQKAKIQGATEYCEAQGIDYYQNDVFKTFGVPKPTGHRIVRKNSARKHHNKPEPESQGRNTIITSEQMREMEHILETEGLEGQGLTWEQLST